MRSEETTPRCSSAIGQRIHLALGIGLSFAMALLSWHQGEKHWLKLEDDVPNGGEPKAEARGPALNPAGAE